jgi:hypothetical protein
MVKSSKEIDIIYWIDNSHYRIGRMNEFQLQIYRDLIVLFWKRK